MEFFTMDQVREIIARSRVAVVEQWHDPARKVDYPVVMTPGAFDKKFIGVILPGAFEAPGIWSSALLALNRMEEGTMIPYFREFDRRGWGLLALSPYHFSPQAGEEESAYQLDAVFARLAPGQSPGLIGYSAGARYLLHYLCSHAGSRLPTAGVVLLDPVPPTMEAIAAGIPACLADALIFSAELHQEGGLGRQTAGMLNLPAVCMACYHSQIPHQALPQVLDYWARKS